MTRIQLEQLRKEFDDLTAVDGIELTVQPGEFLVVVGPSGCGKSTTLRTIAGLEEATAGTVRFGDEEVTDVEAQNRDVAMVFQNYALYPHMTARKNMSFGASSATDLTSDEIGAKVDEAAAILDIEDLLDRKPAALSGGEQQRVAIGRALVRDPEVLLMDEPLSNLDAKLRTEMRTELQTLHAELETTTVYVTHDQTEAMTLGDRVAVMRDGAIQQVDRPQTLYDDPANRFVAEFIGSPSMNLLPVEVRRGSDGPVAANDAFAVRLPGVGKVSSASALLGVRPEDLYLLDDGTVTHTHERPLRVEVAVTESLGDVRLVYGDVAGKELVVSVDPHRDISAGDTLELVCDPDRLHLFDADDGGALYHGSEPTNQVADQSTESPRL